MMNYLVELNGTECDNVYMWGVEWENIANFVEKQTENHKEGIPKAGCHSKTIYV